MCLKCLHEKLILSPLSKSQQTEKSEDIRSSKTPFAVLTPAMLIFKSIKSIKDCVENEKFMFASKKRRRSAGNGQRARTKTKSPICCEIFNYRVKGKILTKLNGRK